MSDLERYITARAAMLGLSRQDLAQRAGASPSTLSRWLHQGHRPSLGSYHRLVEALGLDAEEARVLRRLLLGVEDD